MTKNQAKEALKTLDFIDDNDVRFIRLQFCDLFGQNRNVAVSATEFEQALSNGCRFKSSAVPGYESCGELELTLYPDPSTMMILPWRPQQGKVARVLCNVCRADGTPFESDSRRILGSAVDWAAEQGVQFAFGAKIEFYLFELDDEGRPTLCPSDTAGFFDLAPLDNGENTRREIILTLENMGFNITSSHHERGPGQHEIDFSMADPVTCADNIQTFKGVVKTIAERNGMHASFMPKPLNDAPGSGMHLIITMEKDGENLFSGKDGALSKTGRAFAGGLFTELPAITAIADPIVNSYKRLAGGCGAPSEIAWQPGAEEAVVRPYRVPHDGTALLLRSPDAAANPYLLFALVMRAGLIGVDAGLDAADMPARALPNTLLAAIEDAWDSALFADVLGAATARRYLAAKQIEWQDYVSTVHDWEINQYFATV